MAALSLTLGVQLNMRLSEVVFEIIAVLTRMYLQLYACEPYKNNHNVVDQHADNQELIYSSSTNTRAWTCIQTHSHVNDNATIAVAFMMDSAYSATSHMSPPYRAIGVIL